VQQPADHAELQSVSSGMLSLPQINADKEVYTKGTRSISSMVMQKGAAITSIESVMQRYPLPPKKGAKKEEKKKEPVVVEAKIIPPESVDKAYANTVSWN